MSPQSEVLMKMNIYEKENSKYFMFWYVLDVQSNDQHDQHEGLPAWYCSYLIGSLTHSEVTTMHKRCLRVMKTWKGAQVSPIHVRFAKPRETFFEVSLIHTHSKFSYSHLHIPSRPCHFGWEVWKCFKYQVGWMKYDEVSWMLLINFGMSEIHQEPRVHGSSRHDDTLKLGLPLFIFVPKHPSS